MSIRSRFKFWLYGRCPGFAGSFRYFGEWVYFPKNSLAFLAACQQGIFEAANVRVLQQLYMPGSYMFDVGANIGLIAIPVLSTIPQAKVVSFEPSPNSLPSLRRTIDGSRYQSRWSLIPKAVGSACGRSRFAIGSPAMGLFDGLRPTGRVPQPDEVEVDLTTIDTEWSLLDKPPVSAIKIDVEGAELQVLEGASKCLAKARPIILLEWSRINLNAFGTDPNRLVAFAADQGFRIFALPHMVGIDCALELNLQMLTTESFLLVPTSASSLVVPDIVSH